jgi:hypothetical protein
LRSYIVQPKAKLNPKKRRSTIFIVWQMFDHNKILFKNPVFKISIRVNKIFEIEFEITGFSVGSQISLYKGFFFKVSRNFFFS